MANHTVKQGEHLSSIAATYGFSDYRTIWDHGNNASLKQKRKNPNVLYPGDSLYIPDIQRKEVDCHTGAKHVFKLNAPELELWLVIRDCNHLPRPHTACTLKIDGASEKLTTDGDGVIHKMIPRTAKEGSVTVDEVEIPIKIGNLDPVDTLSGQVGRLNNLGYDAGDPEGPDDEQFESAVQEFQCDQKLTVDGICGSKTQAKLTEVHGC
jgi:N-acetylmuramoyl-L-alanine amidase